MKIFAPSIAFIFVAATAFAQEVSLQITPFEDLRYKGRISATFINDTKQTIKLLQPLAGSEWRWHKPYYDFSVFDSQGQQMQLGLRCGLSGLYSTLQWPDDYLIILEPGMKLTIDLDLPFPIPSDGDYQVTLLSIV